MKRDLQGYYIAIPIVEEKAEAFIPASLPPIKWSSELREKFDQARLALGRIDRVSVLLLETSLFFY